MKFFSIKKLIKILFKINEEILSYIFLLNLFLFFHFVDLIQQRLSSKVQKKKEQNKIHKQSPTSPNN